VFVLNFVSRNHKAFMCKCTRIAGTDEIIDCQKCHATHFLQCCVHLTVWGETRAVGQTCKCRFLTTCHTSSYPTDGDSPLYTLLLLTRLTSLGRGGLFPFRGNCLKEVDSINWILFLVWSRLCLEYFVRLLY